MLLRLAYLAVSNAFAVLRLLPMSDRDKDAEILDLRHQITCRREVLDRTLIWNHAHLLHALREFEEFYNSHRPHQGIANARPLHPLPVPITDPQQITRLDIRRRERLDGIFHEYQHAV
ncbi:hypothetical protein ABZ402_50545 [Streptomyces mirabilis]|uniref:hypothetical protein n=1 Tax=Streptomyces mirabilis TaxID=68239 RepID=UPI00340DA2F2